MDDKKYIKYTTDTITDKDDLKLGKSFQEMVMEAVKQALKEGIKANSIIINKDFVRVKKSWINNGFSYSELPDMICGLEVYLTDDDLPEDYSFAVVEKSHTEREKLIGKTKSDTAREIYKELFKKQTEVYNKYVFKKDNDYDDLETNAIINFSDSLSYEFEKYFKEKHGVDLVE